MCSKEQEVIQWSGHSSMLESLRILMCTAFTGSRYFHSFFICPWQWEHSYLAKQWGLEEVWALKWNRNGVFLGMAQSMLLLILLNKHKMNKDLVMESSWAPKNTPSHAVWKYCASWVTECCESRWAGHSSRMRNETRKVFSIWDA